MTMDVGRTLSLLHGLVLTLGDRMWQKVFAQAKPLNQLPKPRGPYGVGCLDLMTGSSDGVFVRLFYPTKQEVTTPSVTWIPDRKYVDGLAKFVRVWPPLFRFLFRLVVGDLYLPVTWKAVPEVSSDVGGWPVVVFSHGLGGCRTTYTTLCAELASRGFLVAATEHRDQTACLTFIKDGPETRWVEYRRVVEGEDAYAIRNGQVHQRASECVRALDLLLQLNAGNQLEHVLDESFEWTSFKGLMDPSRVGLLGHSFGGATLLPTLTRDPRFGVGVALDAWMYPVRLEPVDQLDTPILLINMQKFQTEVNVKSMRRLQSGSIVTLVGGAHQNPSDVPFLSEHTRFNQLFNSGTSLPPLLAINVISALTIRFLCTHLKMARIEELEKELEANKDLVSPEALLPLTSKI